ncbi:cysteine proteinase [Backusella circina FSU 941]|nr:cysteine proteinase [Backusella circina FSU 941]
MSLSTTTSHPINYLHNSNYGFQPLFTIEEIRQRASVNKADTEGYPIKRWISTVFELYNKGDECLQTNQIENAYIYYKKGCSVMIEIIKQHSKFHEIRSDSVYLKLNKRTEEEMMLLLQQLAFYIETTHRSTQQPQQQPQPNYGYIQPITNPYYNQQQPIMYPMIPPTSAAPYAYRPSHDPRNFPHYTLNDVPSQQMIASHHSPNTNATNTTATNTTASSSTFSSSSASTTSSSSSSVFTTSAGTTTSAITPTTATATKSNNNNNTMTAINYAMSSKLKITTINIPPPTNNLFPNIPTIEPMELAKWITRIDNPPTILLIDVRPRNLFLAGCIKYQWIIQIDPSILHPNITSQDIHASLSVDAEQSLFSEKDKFDLIVYYDQNSKTIESQRPIHDLKEFLLFSTSLRRPPMMLTGGMDRWTHMIGDKGIYRFSSSSSSSSGKSSSWFSKSKDHHHTLYDYFSTGKSENITKPQPLPTAPRKESLTTRYPELSPPSTPPATSHDVKPVPPSYAKLHRRRTFIDNPFNGFTTTTSKLYDVPPTMHPTQQQDEGIKKEQVPSRPTLVHHPMSTSSKPAPPPSAYEHSFSSTIGKTGLKNVGNTCYMNSIIQCLSGTIPLARYFISGLFKQHLNRANRLGTGGVLAESFAETIRVMWSESYRFIQPMSFRDALIRFAPQFSGTDQQDSQEFLTFLLDGLHEDLNPSQRRVPELDAVAFEKLPDWQASAMAWERYMERNASIIVSLFQGQYRSRLTCLSCRQTSTTYNAFMSLSLPIPIKKLRLSSVTLYQCLDYFVKEETLDKEDAWFCPKCKKKRKAVKQLTLSKLPDVLLIHLKRFSVDGLFKNKLDSMVKYPTRSLDLSGYIPSSMFPPQTSLQDNASFIYDLYAVSNHYGTLSGGHYTATVRDGKNQWHYFDDSKFSPCDESKVVTKAAYNLFYVRSKVK